MSNGQKSISVLIPARNEGLGAIRAIESVIKQDYAGDIRIYLLIKDETDTAMPLLEKHFPLLKNRNPIAYETSNRSISVIFCGTDPKCSKINFILDRIDSDLVAILDADHIAEPEWLESSVVLLAENDSKFIQCRRLPISATGFFQLWDSLHQHIGCETFNHIYSKLGLSVFFTGTTAVIEATLIKEHRLSPCLTEDTDLSYRLLTSNEKIIYNPHFGSSEEVSPDFYSFIARRRRWANGHTEAFFKIFNRSNSLSPKQFIQFLFHGVHYLVAIPVYLLHLLFNISSMSSLSWSQIALSTFVGTVFSIFIANGQKTTQAIAKTAELLLSFTWIFSNMVLLCSLFNFIFKTGLEKFAFDETSNFVLFLGLLGFLAPLFFVLSGLYKLKVATFGVLVTVVTTYPLAYLADLIGITFGLSDLVLGNRIWRAISRSASDLNQGIQHRGIALKKTSMWAMSSLVPGILVAAVGIGIVSKGTNAQVRTKCEILAHDKEPWYKPTKDLNQVCSLPKQIERRQYKLEKTDSLIKLDSY